MHIQYSEEHRWLMIPFPGDAILCVIREDGHIATTFTLPIAWHAMAHATPPATCWQYARERCWDVYTQFCARRRAAQGA